MPTHDFENIGDVLDFEILKGKITAIDPATDTCTVTVAGSSREALIFYHCNPDSIARDNGAIEGGAAGFAVDDEVVVMINSDNSVIKVIGHVDGIRSCYWEPWNGPKITTKHDWRLYYAKWLFIPYPAGVGWVWFPIENPYSFWYYGNGEPTALHVDGDFYTNLLTGDNYHQELGTWVFVDTEGPEITPHSGGTELVCYLTGQSSDETVARMILTEPILAPKKELYIKIKGKITSAEHTNLIFYINSSSGTATIWLMNNYVNITGSSGPIKMECDNDGTIPIDLSTFGYDENTIITGAELSLGTMGMGSQVYYKNDFINFK